MITPALRGWRHGADHGHAPLPLARYGQRAISCRPEIRRAAKPWIARKRLGHRVGCAPPVGGGSNPGKAALAALRNPWNEIALQTAAPVYPRKPRVIRLTRFL